MTKKNYTKRLTRALNDADVQVDLVENNLVYDKVVISIAGKECCIYITDDGFNYHVSNRWTNRVSNVVCFVEGWIDGVITASAIQRLQRLDKLDIVCTIYL